MDNSYKEKLKTLCSLVKYSVVEGAYSFEGPCMYGLLFMNIPDDCKCIEIFKLACEINSGELYPENKVLTRRERKEVTKFMQTKGFKFKRGSKRLDQSMGIFSGYIDENNILQDRMHLYYYFYKQDWLDNTFKKNMIVR